MKSCVLYRRTDGWYVHSHFKTKSGAGIAGPFFAKQTPELDAFGLGSLVFRALQNSVPASPPYPTDWGAVFAPMLDLAGVKTWRRFAKGAACVSVEFNGDKIELIPMRNDGSANFVALDSAPITLTADIEALQFGEAILQAIELVR
jgi:hypothetical protein